MILIIDNYDSFTYNLYQYVGKFNPDIKVYRNDKIDCGMIEKLNPSHIILSPGPGYPSSAGNMEDIIRKFYKKIPMLGICLGHQAIGEVFGGKIDKAIRPRHGESSYIELNNDKLFNNIKSPMEIGRYHSLVIKKDSLKDLEILAETKEGEIMAIKHPLYPVYGVQFHPESVLTPDGIKIIYNFLNI